MTEQAKELTTQKETNVIPMDNGKPDLLAMAVSNGADVATIEKLMDLKERNDKYEAEKLYTAAMNDFRAKCPPVNKTKEGHNCKYAGLAETIEAIKETESECGISHRWTTGKDSDGLVLVTCIVSHVGGHSESTTLTGEPDTTGSKNTAQAVGSIVSYLQRYTLFAALGIAAGDEDTDGHTVNLAELQDAIKKHWKSIAMIKQGIENAKEDGNYYEASEAWFELEDNEKASLWIAPTKGGIFTTEERKIMQSREFRKAYYPDSQPINTNGDKK